MTLSLTKSIWLILTLFVLICPMPQATAQSESASDRPSFIRDAEIENYLRTLATPLYQAALIDPANITIVIVDQNVVNAFVAEGMNEFFYTGLLELTDTPEQLAGVIAHETGHIAGGHLIRGAEAMRNASAEAIFGTLLSIAAGVLSGNAGAAAGGISGAQQIAGRGFLAFSRTTESSADAAAMSFLDRAGVSSRGLLEFFKKLQGQEALPYSRQLEYIRTHPLTNDRIDAVQYHLDHSPPALRDARLPDKIYDMHSRMRAKLLGYLHPETALLRYTDKDQKITSRYARAIALYRTSQIDRALKIMEGLIQNEPANPFFYEMKGQIFFDSGRVRDAIAQYQKANSLLPDSSLLRVAYGHALLESKDAKLIDLAIAQFLKANEIEDSDPTTWRMLASSWGRKGEVTHDAKYNGLVTYALAEEALAEGRDKVAGNLATQALKTLPKSSPYWLRAQDIRLAAKPDDDTDSPQDKSP